MSWEDEEDVKCPGRASNVPLGMTGQMLLLRKADLRQKLEKVNPEI